MKITKLPQALSHAVQKSKTLREDINNFKPKLSHYLKCLAATEENKEHEENFKKYLIDFLQTSFYQDHLINTSKDIDLAIFSENDPNSPINVLFEIKRPSSTDEFLSPDDINKKALHQLLLYYLRERVDKQNNNIKHLIATNGYEWFLFKSEDFYTHFYENDKLKKEYIAFRDGKKDSSSTKLFYDEIANKYIKEVGDSLNYVYFNLKDYEPYLDLENKKDNKLVSLYKTLSSTHLLNKAFGNDSNQLNKAFYGELLHLIGLEEVKDKGKKVIQRLAKERREYGSLLESAIFTLDDRDYLHKVPNLRSYGTNKEEQLFNVGLELCLTWINRILFLKLLESQLLGYHDNDKNYRFLHQEFIKGFDDLEALFFSALAKQPSERSERYKDKYKFIPYLNSSLFEPNELEDKVMQLSNIKDEKIKLHNKTVLKDGKNKRLTGEKNTLFYLFEFLEAYDFSTDDKVQVEEGDQSKGLINASVLGLIFEKINGYKDGSFYTPSYITMYMSRETLRRAVLQKMNTHYNWKCSKFEYLCEDLSKYITAHEDRNKARLEANQVINTLKICDPAVGSGHFLVSCLNELIAIKSELDILCDEKGSYLYISIKLENDELIIKDKKGDFFSYDPSIEGTHQAQKALFHEKQTLIENCLFAVDINPNSVKICRLRLWIELLKNAYYNKNQVLQTLPNIDINIKCGNSLISRFGLEDDLKTAFKSKENPYSLKDYKNAVKEYKQTNDKARKREIQTIIDTIKRAFKDSLDTKFKTKISKARGLYTTKQSQLTLFGTKKDKTELKRLKNTLDKLEAQKTEILDNVIYQDSFEWRFEFPEVLDKKGAFLGFDVVIGNPPYIRHEEIKWMKGYLKANYSTYTGTGDIYIYFVEKAFDIMRERAQFSYIMPNKWMQTGYGKPLRNALLSKGLHNIIDFGDLQVFEEATTYPCILEVEKTQAYDSFYSTLIQTLDFDNSFQSHIEKQRILLEANDLDEETWIISSKEDQSILKKLNTQCISLGNYVGEGAYRGIVTGLTEAFIINNDIQNKILNNAPNTKEFIKPLLQGRDVKPYITPNVSKYLLFIPWHFPLHNDPNVSGASKEAEIQFKLNYPTIYNHLLGYKEKLEKRNKTETGIRYEWYAMQRWAAAYWKEFEKPKIMYQVFQVKPCFIYDNKGLYCNNSMWMIPKDDKVLVAILNSKMGWWLISKYCTAIQNGYQLIWKYFSKISIPQFTSEQGFPIIELVNKILALKEENPKADTAELEQEIDVLVYQLYNLTYEEVLIVDSTFPLSKAEYENPILA